VDVVADKAAVGLAKPFGERAIVPAPDDVVAIVAVEIAGPDDRPVGRDNRPGMRVIACEAPFA